MLQAQADKPKPKLLDGKSSRKARQNRPRNRPSRRRRTTPVRPWRCERNSASRLPSNPSTGFGWKVASYDREFLQLLRNRYQKPEQPRPGAGGQELFDFLSLKSGSTIIVFHYQRPFEKQVGRELRQRS